MDNAWDITAEGQENIKPEMKSQPDLKKYANGWKDDGDKNTNDVHDERLSFLIDTTAQRIESGLVHTVAQIQTATSGIITETKT